MLLHPARPNQPGGNPAPRPVPRRLGTVAVWVAAVLMFAMLLVPVLLLPVSTAAPVWVWVLLLGTDGGLAVWLLRSPPTRARLFAGVAAVAVVAVVASQVFAATPPITGTDGRPHPRKHRQSGEG